MYDEAKSSSEIIIITLAHTLIDDQLTISFLKNLVYEHWNKFVLVNGDMNDERTINNTRVFLSWLMDQDGEDSVKDLLADYFMATFFPKGISN